MKEKAITDCLLHWSKQVEKGDIAFRFKAVEDSHMRVPKLKKKRDNEEEQSSKLDYTSTSTQLKSQRAHSLLKSEDQTEPSTNGDASTQVAPRSVDGDDSNDGDDGQDAGNRKGKKRHIPPSWYDYHISAGTAS
jgi:hypothetical protein